MLNEQTTLLQLAQTLAPSMPEKTVYLYHAEEMKRRYRWLKNEMKLQSELAFFDPSCLPHSKALGALLTVFDGRLLCRSTQLSELVTSLGVESSRVFSVLPPSEQPCLLRSNTKTTIAQSFDSPNNLPETALVTQLGSSKNVSEETQIHLREDLSSSQASAIIIHPSNSFFGSDGVNQTSIGVLKDFEEWFRTASGLSSNIHIGWDLTQILLAKTIGLLITTLYTKSIRDERFAVCSAGTNVLWDAGQGLNSRRHKYAIFNLSRHTPEDSSPINWTVTGPLCTPSDVLAYRYPLSSLKTGDRLLIPCDRAELYFSPMHFILHERPLECVYSDSTNIYRNEQPKHHDVSYANISV